METYPRHRCPECKKFFRVEIKFPALSSGENFDPTVLACPRCGFQFYRFPIPAPVKLDRANPQ